MARTRKQSGKVANRSTGAAARGRKATARFVRKDMAPTRSEAPAPRRGPKARVAEEVYREVEAMVASGMTRSEAFRRLAEKMGRRPHSIQTNYYRARQRMAASGRAVTRGRRGRPPGRPATRAVGRAGAAPTGKVEELLDRARAAITDALQAVREYERELLRLRNESARLQQLKQLLGKL